MLNKFMAFFQAFDQLLSRFLLKTQKSRQKGLWGYLCTPGSDEKTSFLTAPGVIHV